MRTNMPASNSEHPALELNPVGQSEAGAVEDSLSYATPEIAQRSTSGSSQRIPALDFTKGALVLIMVLYHWLNYFYGPHDSRYLRFLTPSFIFITGFLISNVYLSKYGISSSRLPNRLTRRGLKLLGVFFLLNAVRYFLTLGSYQRSNSSGSTVGNIIDIYVVGSGVGAGQAKAVAFYILVPIGYLLVLSALLVLATRYYRHAFTVACLVGLLCTLAMSATRIESPNLQLLTVGLLGVIAGYLPVERVNGAVRHPYFLAAAYLLYLAAIRVWNVIYPLQIVGVYLSLMIIYLVGQQKGEAGKARSCVLLLGKYSLVGYIAQIAILQILSVAFNQLDIDSRAFVLASSFVLAFALTIISVAVVDRARSKSVTVDRLYRAVLS
jgi:hypothetical protein